MATFEGNTPVPTLASICMKVIAVKIDKIDAVRLREITEYEWETIVKFKCQMMSGSKSSSKSIAPSKKKFGKIPAINELVITEIEGKNPHLRSSKVVDELIWKDCVNYHFPKDGSSRPTILYLPWPTLVENYKKVGITLLSLLKKPDPSSGEAENSLKRTKKLEKCIHMLRDAPMCLKLLSQSGIGKSVKKFIKLSRKIFPKGRSLEDCEVPDFFPALCSARWPSQCAVNQHFSDRHSSTLKSMEQSTSLVVLEKLVLGWKAVASEEGAEMNENFEKKSSHSNQYTGRSDLISEKQHERDITNAQKCTEWRKLFVMLSKRKVKMTASNAVRLKRNVDNEWSSKLTTARTSTKTKSVSMNRNTSSSSGSKLRDMRQGLKDANKIMKSMATSRPMAEASAFGAAVAGAKVDQKKKPQWDGQSRGLKRGSNLIFGNGISKRDIALGGGKKLKLPRSSRNS